MGIGLNPTIKQYFLFVFKKEKHTYRNHVLTGSWRMYPITKQTSASVQQLIL